MTDKTVKELLVKLEALQPEEPVLFSGSTTMEKEMFSALYEPLLDKVIEKRGKVRVGCANGCDTLVQQHCLEANYLNVHVFVPSEAATANVVCLSDSFEKTVVEGGFKKRDRAMQVGCKHSVGFYSQYAGAASGTAANQISIAAKNGVFGDACKELDGYAVVDFLRKYACLFNDSLARQVQLAEAEQYAIK